MRDDLRQLLDAPSTAHLATVMPDGGPHSVPVWVGRDGEQIVFMTGPTSRKARNLSRDPRVAISMTARDNPFAMAAIRGRVVKRVDGDAAWPTVDALSVKYTGGPYPRSDARSAYFVEVEHVWGMSFG